MSSIACRRWLCGLYLPDKYPLYWHELRRRMAVGRLLWLLLAEAVVLSAVALVLLRLLPIVPGHGDLFVRPLTWGILGAQALCAFVLGPALTASSFAAERERGTLEMLLLTRIPTSSLLWQKFCAPFTLLALMLMSSLPIFAIVAATLGGLSPVELFLGYAGALLLGGIGLMQGMSASCQRHTTVMALCQGYGMHGVRVLVYLPCVFLSMYTRGSGLIVSLILIAYDFGFTYAFAVSALEAQRGEYLPGLHPAHQDIPPPPPPRVLTPQAINDFGIYVRGEDTDR